MLHNATYLYIFISPFRLKTSYILLEGELRACKNYGEVHWMIVGFGITKIPVQVQRKL